MPLKGDKARKKQQASSLSEPEKSKANPSPQEEPEADSDQEESEFIEPAMLQLSQACSISTDAAKILVSNDITDLDLLSEISDQELIELNINLGTRARIRKALKVKAKEDLPSVAPIATQGVADRAFQWDTRIPSNLPHFNPEKATLRA